MRVVPHHLGRVRAGVRLRLRIGLRDRVRDGRPGSLSGLARKWVGVGVWVRVRVRAKVSVRLRDRDRVRAVGRPGSLSPQTRAARDRPARAWLG